MKSNAQAFALIVALFGILTAMAHADDVTLAGKILLLDAEDGTFLLKTEQSEIRITTTAETTYWAGEVEVNFLSLKLNDTVRVTGQRQGDEVQATEVVKDERPGAGHEHHH